MAIKRGSNVLGHLSVMLPSTRFLAHLHTMQTHAHLFTLPLSHTHTHTHARTHAHTHTHTQDHDVREENILLVSILAAKLGLHSVAYAYPRVRIITSAVDKEVNEHFHIIPGVGNYGDRYFGTEPY